MQNLPFRSVVSVSILDSDTILAQCRSGHQWEEWAGGLVEIDKMICHDCTTTDPTELEKLSAREVWDLGEQAGVANQGAWDGWRYSGDNFPIENPFT